MAKLGWLLMVVAAFSGQAFGCKCGGMGTCQKAQARGTMFVGQVLSVREPGKGQGQRVFRFRVAESFAGPEGAGEELEVATGLGGGDCGIEFSLGQRYFVNASGSAGALSTGSCTWTAPLAFAAVTLRQLRAQAAGDRLPDLSGTVATAQYRHLSGDPGPQPLGGCGRQGASFSDPPWRRCSRQPC